MNSLEIIRKNNDFLKEINHILNKHGIQEEVSLKDLSFGNHTVLARDREDLKLAPAIINHIWPSISKQTVYHYTDKDAAENILATKKFRLTNIQKRIYEDEIKTLCDRLSLHPYGTDELDQTFYASFVQSNLTQEQEEYFWRTFAPCDGVRLKFEITATNSNLRNMIYHKEDYDPMAIIQEVQAVTEKMWNKKFVFQGLSMLCAFYLPNSYHLENETRIAYKERDFTQILSKNAQYTYIELPLGEVNRGFKIDVLEVCASEKLIIPDSIPFLLRPT